MITYKVEYHKKFWKDLDKLDKKHLDIFYKKFKKIQENPERQKHLSGVKNSYREAITKNIRLIYCLEENVIKLLIIDNHEEAYDGFFKRLYSLR